MKRPVIETFTIFQEDSHGQVFLELGPRYNSPQDDTTVLRVGHKTIDSGGISVLLEMADFEALRLALATRETWDQYGRGQTNADLSMALGQFAIWWRGSGRTRTFTFSPGQAEAMAQWMADRIEQGWTGWKSGVIS